MIKHVLSKIDIKRRLQIIRIIVRWRPSEFKPAENKGCFILEAGNLKGNDQGE